MIKLETRPEDLAALAGLARKIEFFSPLNVGQLDQVLPYVGLYDCEAGETVFKQGDPGDAFYIVYRGKVTVRAKKGFFSGASVVAEIGPGGFFGEIALLSRAPRMATVVCETSTQLFSLVHGDFQFVLKGNPALAAQMGRIAERRSYESSRGD